MDGLDGCAAALQVVESYLERRRRGEAESIDVLLARHPDLRDVLAAMLPVAMEMTVTTTATAATPVPAAGAAAWRGLPGEGDQIGGYRVLRTLGQGGMGVVFLAEDVRLGRKVALKLVRPERLGAGVARERFWREATLAARLEHPHICPVYEVGEAFGMPFLAMRYIEGQTLAARIAAARQQSGGPRPSTGSGPGGEIEDTLWLLERVARAVHHAHERGVVHRDIKPLNILVDSAGEPFVLDFGMAGDVEDRRSLTGSDELVGTPYYMPPEVVEGRTGQALDRRADVYSLGVTLYETLTGVLPFTGVSVRELLDAIVRDTPAPARRRDARVPRDLDVVLAKAMEKDRNRRYKTAADFADELRRVRVREPIRARRAGPMLRLRRWVQRNPIAAAFLVVVAAALVVIASLYLREQRAYQRELAARRDFDLVALVPRLRDLEAQELAAYADWPEHASALRAWSRQVETLVEDAREAEAVHGRLLADASPHEDRRERFLRETLATLLRDLAALTDPQTGLLAHAHRNLAWSERARQETIDTQSAAWNAAVAGIAAHPRYGGLQLTPQVDLVPIGPDPISSLWEFWHTRSGQVPERGADGKLAVGEDTGLVFVLLPRATVTVGCQNLDPALPNHDELARAEEGPVREVQLDAFFIAKHELSQGQWQRLGDDSNPSDFRPGGAYARTIPTSLAHPVERVSWQMATDLLYRHGLELPSEAQWEYAYRGGTTTPWWTGAEAMSLSGRVNLADRAAHEAGLRLVEIDVHYHDGHAYPAPVDALAPNPFGLHHIAGNLWEWCRDAWSAQPPRNGDGLRSSSATGPWVHRGGGFESTVVHCRAAFRRQGTSAENVRGVRSARRIR